MRILLLLIVTGIYSVPICRSQESGLSVEEQAELDSLEQLTSALYHDTIRADAYIKISLLLYISNFDTLFLLNEIAQDIASSDLSGEIAEQERKTRLRLQSEAMNNIAYYQQESGNFDEALSNYQFCLQIDKSQHNYSAISVTLNNIGMIYYYQGQIVKALDYFLFSLRIDESIADPAELGPPLNNLAYIYEHQGDTANALIYYYRALSAFELAKNEPSQALAYINIGSVLRRSNQQEAAISNFKKSLEIGEKHHSNSIKASALLNLGNVYFERANYDSAALYLNEALPLYEQSSDRAGLSICYINLGKIAYVKKDLPKAQILGEKGLNISIEVGSIYNQKAAYNLLSQVYQATNQYDKSLMCYQHFIELRDSLLNTETKQQAFQKKLEYEYDKEQALANLNHKKELAISEQEKKNQFTILFFSLFLLILVIVFALVISTKLKKTRDQKRLIEEKNRENELLLGEIHHRVKNNLQVISSLLSLQEKSLTDASAKHAILESKERVKSMGLIHKMLYQHDNFSGINMSGYIEELVDGLFAAFGISRDNVDFHSEIEQLRVDVDTAIPLGLILNELIVNTLKHSTAEEDKLMLKIMIKKTDNHLLVEVQDNGKGKTEEIQLSTSFGSKLIKSLVRQLNGKMSITDQNGLHYTIEITDYKLV